MFRIELLPAAHGDSIWIEYGDPKEPRRIVIDGGPAPTYERGLRARLGLLPKNGRIDLFVITHIDADHIDGSIILLREAAQLGVHFDEIWFNAWAQIGTEQSDNLKPLQGEFLGALLDTPGIRESWNTRAKGLAIVVPETGPLPAWDLPDDEATTIAGLVIHEAQTIPEPGQAFTFHGYRFEILRKSRNKITAIRVKPTEAAKAKQSIEQDPMQAG